MRANEGIRSQIEQMLRGGNVEPVLLLSIVCCVLDLTAHHRTVARGRGDALESYVWTYALEREIARKLGLPVVKLPESDVLLVAQMTERQLPVVASAGALTHPDPR